MTRARAAVHRVRDERGAVLVLVALMLPVLVGVGGLVVDVGNWFAHKRHLQVQADAGALAGAGKFRIPCDAGVSARVVEESAKYSSVEYSGSLGYPGTGTGFNPLTATPAGLLHRETNSKRFFGRQGPDDDTVEKPPCDAKMIDVKLTETDLPWFVKAYLSATGPVPYIDAQARVEIKKKTIGKGALPIGIPEVGPQKAEAIFVNEETGAVITSTPLARTGTSDGLAIWSNAALPKTVTINSATIGVRIVVSGGASTTCGQPLVTCYGAGTSTQIQAGKPGLVPIRGWTSTPEGTATAPLARNVDLLKGSCEDGYFTARATYPCTVGVRATIDGLAPTATVFAKRATGANTKIPLTFSGGAWTAASGIPISAGEGPVDINLFYGSGNGTRIGTAPVQRSFAGDESLDVSGPIKLLRLSENGIPGRNSFPRCAGCTRDLVVTMGLSLSLMSIAQSNLDPVVSLKLEGGGPLNRGLDCDTPNLRQELANGCAPGYTVNTGDRCPNANPEPYNCVYTDGGESRGQVRQGMSLRILGDANPSACTAPNNWPSYPDLPAGDPRIVNVFLTPYGAFDGGGRTSVPVTGFATFYVTGWDSGKCQGTGDDPAGRGEIVGHFIKYIDTLNTGGASEEVCDFDSLGLCVAVITR